MFLVGSDDGHEELLAAANAVINPSTVFAENSVVILPSKFLHISLN